MTEESARELLARVTCNGLHLLEHSRGVAWTAHILLDGVYAGTAEDDGMGGDVTFAPIRVTSDRVRLVWEETVARATEIGRALVTLKEGGQEAHGPGWYACDVFAWLEPTYEGRPMTLLDAYNLMNDPSNDEALGIIRD